MEHLSDPDAQSFSSLFVMHIELPRCMEHHFLLFLGTPNTLVSGGGHAGTRYQGVMGGGLAGTHLRGT